MEKLSSKQVSSSLRRWTTTSTPLFSSLLLCLSLIIFSTITTTSMVDATSSQPPLNEDGNVPVGSALLAGKMFNMDRSAKARLRQKRLRRFQKEKEQLKKQEQLFANHPNGLDSSTEISEEELEMLSYEDLLHSSRQSQHLFRNYIMNLTYIDHASDSGSTSSTDNTTSSDLNLIKSSKSMSNNYMLSHFAVDQMSLHDIERYLAIKEFSNIYKLRQELLQRSIDIYGFFHVSTNRMHWKDMLTEQLYLLDGRRKFPTSIHHRLQDDSDYSWDRLHRYASLLSITKHLYINVVGSNKQVFDEVKEHVDQLRLRERNLVYLHFNFTLTNPPASLTSSSLTDSTAAAGGATGGGGGAASSPSSSASSAAPSAQQQKQELEHKQHSIGEYSTLSTMQYFCKRMIQLQDKREINKRGITRQEREFVQQNKFGGNILFEKFTKISSNESDPISRRNKRKLSKRTLVYYMNNELPLSEYRPGFLTIFSSSVYNAYNLEFPSVCIRAVGMQEYATCGVDLQLQQALHPRYKSNMWWSDCHHISQLEEIQDRWHAESSYDFINHFHKAKDTNQHFAQQCTYSSYQASTSTSTDSSASTSTSTSTSNGVLMRTSILPTLWQQIMSTPLPSFQWILNTTQSDVALTTTKAERESHVVKFHDDLTIEQEDTEKKPEAYGNVKAICQAIRQPSLYQLLIQPVLTQNPHWSSYLPTSSKTLARKSYEQLQEIVKYYTTPESRASSSTNEVSK